MCTGWTAGHHKVFADELAERLSNDPQNNNDVAVLIPDLFRGTPILQPWMNNDNMAKDMVGSLMGAPGMVYRCKQYPPEKVESDIFHLLIPYITQQLELDEHNNNVQLLPKLSCVGFCFGGWVVGRILGFTQRQSLQFECGVGIHPSFAPNMLHLESTTAMAERIHRPILLLPAWGDMDMKPNTAIVNAITRKLQDIQQAKSEKNDFDGSLAPGKGKAPLTVSIEFPTMMHGWMSRGDPTDPNVAAEQERCMQLTEEFIRSNS